MTKETCTRIQVYLLLQSDKVYGVHKAQMPLPGPCVSVGTLVLNCGATNATPTQKHKHLLSSKRRPHFQTHKWSCNEQNFDNESRRMTKNK
jgi:hypothetical protein